MKYTTSIGQNIAKLRRDKQAKQEELAIYVGVSAQAVSKWENGGMPDADLLPQIADFFDVSVDTLFGRMPIESRHLRRSLIEAVSGENDLIDAFDICAMLMQALQADDESAPESKPVKLEDDVTPRLMSVQRNCGFAKMLVTDFVPYFLLIPDFSEQRADLFGAESLPALFADLGDENFFKTLVYLMSRESNKAFTPNLLTKKLGFTDEETIAVIEKLLRYRLLSSTIVEIDDEDTVMYKAEYNQSFSAMIRFARELIPMGD